MQIGLAAKRARRRQADPSADGLLEPHEAVTDLCLRPERPSIDRRERDLVVGPVDPSGDERAAAAAVVDDPAVLDGDERPKLVRLAKGVGVTQPVDVAERLRRRLVEVRHRDPEGRFGIASSTLNGSHVIAVTDDSIRIRQWRGAYSGRQKARRQARKRPP